MRCGIVARPRAAFTLVELAILLVSVLLLYSVFLLIKPGGCYLKEKAPRVRCMANQKQLALGFALWANEHDGKFPMETPSSAGGSREYALAGNLLSNLIVAADQIRDPRILTCPTDKKRKPAASFTNLTTADISYFLNIDALYTNQSQILLGDRNVALNGSPARPGLLPIPDPNAISWSSDLHVKAGNVALADASVHQITTGHFGRLLATGITNRFIIP